MASSILNSMERHHLKIRIAYIFYSLIYLYTINTDAGICAQMNILKSALADGNIKKIEHNISNGRDRLAQRETVCFIIFSPSMDHSLNQPYTKNFSRVANNARPRFFETSRRSLNLESDDCARCCCVTNPLSERERSLNKWIL